MKSIKNKKQVAVIGICIAVILCIVAPLVAMSQGTMMQAETSVNPTGFYRIVIRNPDHILDTAVNLEIRVVNASGTVRTFAINAGKFSQTGTNESEVFYSYSQSYAVAIAPNFKPDCAPIECEEELTEGKLNIITVRLRAMLPDVDAGISIGEIPPSGSILYEDWTANYEIEAGHNYSIYLWYMNKVCSPFVVGSTTILPPAILQEFYPITYAINRTNYESMCFTVNTTMDNLDCRNRVFDVTPFDYLGASYTNIALMPTSCGSCMENILTFTATETTNISCCLLDGSLDSVFDSYYLKFKIGGGFN